MSNEIYGFVDFPNRLELPDLLQILGASTPLGVFSVPESHLIGFPSNLRPHADSLVFVIGDSKSSMNAEYLLDYHDYDPESTIGLPIDSDERFALLVSLLRYFFDVFDCTRLAVCLTDSNQVDSVKHIKFPDSLDTIKNDCVKESPPCLIYLITQSA